MLSLVKLQAGSLQKLTLLHGCFSRFLNCTNTTKCYSSQLWTAHLSTKKIILLGTRRKQISFFDPIFRNIFFVIVAVTITERFNNHFARITWLVATCLFLLGCVPKFINAPLLYCCSLGQISQLLPSSIISKIVLKNLAPKLQRKLILTRFNSENILSSLVLETGTVNYNLIIITSVRRSNLYFQVP